MVGLYLRSGGLSVRRTGDWETAHGGRHFGLSDPVFAIVRAIRSVMRMLVVFSFVRAFV